jgi:tartrate-resistant acid phosphatase type 5
MRHPTFRSRILRLRLVLPLVVGACWIGLTTGRLCAESVVLGIIGDFGVAAEGAASASNELAVATLVKRWNPDYILALGDNNYPNGAAATIDENIGQFYHEFIHPYTGAYGSGASSNRFFPCLGNHDWVQSGQPSLDYFSLPGNERYYRYRAGPVEVFALNSNADVDGTTPTSVQGVWLRNALTNSTARWKLVIVHHPPYSADASGAGNAYMRWPFAQWGATLVMAGHDHVYARIQTNGISYLINGLGGDDIHGTTGGPAAGVASRFNGDYGAMRMEATESNLVSHFITRNNVLVDTFALGAPVTSPFILAGPVSQTVLAGRTVQFTVMAVGGGSLRYQWLSNSIALPLATNSVLQITNAQPEHEAEYAVILSSLSVSNQTAPARLTILRHPLITVQPRGLNALGGATATLRVVADGAGTLRYQWRLNGLELAGAVNTNLVLTNLTLASAGDYAVLVSDDLGSVLSDTVRLTVLARPIVTQHPVGQAAAVGETVVWSVSAEGTLPMNFSWRRNGRVLTNLLLNSSTCFWAVPNIQLTNAGNYQVGITNIAGPASGLTSNAFLIVLEDRDGDRLPDAWETQFGFNPEDAVDAALDLDGDGASNLAEWLAGTDPASSESVLRMDQLTSIAPETWRLGFLAVSNRTHGIEFRDAAHDESWRTLSVFPAVSTNRPVSVLDSVPAEAAGRRFYRVVTPSLP